MFGDDLVPLLDEVGRDAFLRRDGHRRHGQYGVDLTLRERVRKLPDLTELLHKTPATAGWRWTHQACVATDCLGRRCDLVPVSWGHPDHPAT
jgi:hypothetical protein